MIKNKIHKFVLWSYTSVIIAVRHTQTAELKSHNRSAPSYQLHKEFTISHKVNNYKTS